MTPTIHLNGTDPKVLFSDLQDLRRKAQETLKALEKVWPNKRDYINDEPRFLAAVNEVDFWQQELMDVADGTLKTLGYLADFVNKNSTDGR
jgi:hypothetical protein